MPDHFPSVTADAMKQAIETRDSAALTAFYADDALLQVIDRNSPPSRPRELKGRKDIGAFLTDICSRDMSHSVDLSMSDDNHLAFSESCTYPDGVKVFCMAAVDLKDGKIVRQKMVQAWDE